MASKFRIGICQMLVSANKEANIAKAVRLIADAKSKGAQLVVLPECFNSPYSTKSFAAYSEPIPTAPFAALSGQPAASAALEASPTLKAMAQAAKDNGVYLIAGSIPERDETASSSNNTAASSSEPRLFNTSMAFSPEGELLAKYRKMHLFRLRSEQLTMDEGETLTAGDSPAVLDIKAGGPAGIEADFKIGLAICFDVRYPQLALHYAQQHDTAMVVYPAAFNMVTGPKYWRLSSQSRAVDSQQFVVMASPARDVEAGYVAWGHSHVIDPAGDIIASLDENEGVLVQEVDLAAVGKIRTMLPILSGTRHDVYTIGFCGAKQ